MIDRGTVKEGIQLPANAAHQRNTTSASERIFAAVLVRPQGQRVRRSSPPLIHR
jgi:hypothetical protein